MKLKWWKIVCIVFLLFTFTAGFLINVPKVGNLYESIRNFFSSTFQCGSARWPL